MKRIAVIAGLIILLISAAVGGFALRFRKMAGTVRSEYSKIGRANLQDTPDGIYAGFFGDFIVFVQLEVTVKDHRISSIRIVDQRCSRGYEAVGTIDRIIQAQSPKVDAISGATGSSRCIMIAAHRALRGSESRTDRLE